MPVVEFPCQLSHNLFLLYILQNDDQRIGDSFEENGPSLIEVL
jgi:hypothetical protein